MAQYRKLPVVIEAVQWFPGVGVGGVIEGPYRSGDEQDYPARCPTLEGVFGVTPGDWIITGVRGERYPIKPDIFAQTYTPVTPVEVGVDVAQRGSDRTVRALRSVIDVLPPLFMVFDVESVGLHGKGFAVGWVVVDSTGTLHADGYAACPPSPTHGTAEGFTWINEHVVVRYNHVEPKGVRQEFWRVWRFWAERGAVLVADCAWPVEARFLAACIDDDPSQREWVGPYPLHEVATARLLAGFDPLATVERFANELPQHHPLADARQSARLWLEAWHRLHLTEVTPNG